MKRILLSTIGSRGDVQPLVALALELRKLGAEARLCVPPDFQNWIENLGFSVTTIGPELRKLTGGTAPATTAPISAEMRQRLAEGTVTAQFSTVRTAAEGCDLIVGASALQIAARSVAELLGIPYVFVAYCPNVLPSPHHAPPPMPPLPGGEVPLPDDADNALLWQRDSQRFNGLFGAALNQHRESLGLAPITDVRSHVFTDQPWLAADPILGPWPDAESNPVFQPGAWLVPDDRPLSPELEAFLAAGDPPLYFGFGSIRAPHDLAQVVLQTTRTLHRRAIISRGWANLTLPETSPDVLAIDEVNQQALFPRLAAIVHHGGAGTTTASALSGTPQVLIPQMYDQHYWATRIEALGIGSAHTPGAPTTESLTRALEQSLEPAVAKRAKGVASAIRRDGAAIAAAKLLTVPAR